MTSISVIKKRCRNYKFWPQIKVPSTTRLYPALSNQSELEERAPSSRSQEMTFSCRVPSPLAASSGVPCA